MEDILVPIFICVVLPVACTALVAWQRVNYDNKRAQILIKAIEANNGIDADKLAESLRKPKKSARQTLYNRLLWGCIFTFSSLAVAVFGIIMQCMKEKEPAVTSVLIGGILLAIGLSNLIVYFVSRKTVSALKEEETGKLESLA